MNLSEVFFFKVFPCTYIQKNTIINKIKFHNQKNCYFYHSPNNHDQNIDKNLDDDKRREPISFNNFFEKQLSKIKLSSNNLINIDTTFELDNKDNSSHHEHFGPWKMIKFLIYISLFTVSLLTVGHVIDYKITFVITAVIVLILDIKAYKGVDYSLLATFVFFFVLTGNLGRIKEVTDAMCHILDAKPVLTAIGASQIISNVPAAMLLSTFTDNGEALIIGTNLGGLGTIIASMASLITYRFYGKYKTDNDLKDHYLLKFTIYNIVFLAALYGMYVVM